MDFIIASTYDSYIDAHLAMGNLLSEDINCWLKDENTVTIDPVLTNAVGGIKLMVAAPQIGRALEILQQTKRQYQEQHPCPNCGSANVEYISTPKKASNWLGTFVSVVLNAGAPMAVKKVYHCFDCGFEFDDAVKKTE
ncbi:putative signal transducing protein [Niabella beijingensis]|uniref:putative signal transducing protein n=1 Tax=Niabella beijingensis TaxID=2872700 RepID=UPI001CBC3826|nr:DUF2007 domain-containing protein [Niabella beijingensis]MBZ4189191.1 DUF2007 domain-containing protein [Niabella beijingensis]